MDGDFNDDVDDADDDVDDVDDNVDDDIVTLMSCSMFYFSQSMK